MSPALSALFSFRHAAAEVMCVLLKYLWRTPGRQAFTAPERERKKEKERETDPPNVMLMKILPLILSLLRVNLRDSEALVEVLIKVYPAAGTSQLYESGCHRTGKS